MNNSESRELTGNKATTELSAQDRTRELSLGEVAHRRRMVANLMSDLMKENHHYGRIPGTDKNTLLQPGAQLIDTMFRFSPKFDVDRQDISSAESSIPPGHREYTVTCNLYHIDSGVFVAQGVGSCTTLESKYRYKTAKKKCPECGAETLMKSKYDEDKWYCNPKKGGCGAKINFNDPRMENQHHGKIENPDIADTYNTVLKMAKKRAYVDATITAAAASDMFTQDMEDFMDSSTHHSEPEPAHSASVSPESNTQNVDQPKQFETVEYEETNESTKTKSSSTTEEKHANVDEKEQESRKIVRETVDILQSMYFTEDEQQGYKDAIKHISKHDTDTFARLRDKYKNMMEERKEAEQEYQDAIEAQQDEGYY